MPRIYSKVPRPLIVLVLAVVFIYGNHLNNSFHFDDAHTIVQNPYMRDIRNVPRFFADGDMSSVLPPNRAYRPVLSASLAIDYWLGHGTAPWFHITTLIWFVLQILLIYVLSRRIFDGVSPETENEWPAVFAAALFGLHPVMAETVNYIVQRSELQSTLGVVAGLIVYICFPGVRKFGIYLLPVAMGALAKPPALVFPVLLFLYLWLIEEEQPRKAFARCLPSVAACAAVGFLVAKMTPPAFNPGSFSPYGYRITQPLVMFRYFMKFFVPTGLTADTDHVPLTSIFDDGGLQGMLFLAAMIWAIVQTARRREMRPIAFGLAWFVAALVPASLMALAEVENDHRMFFPFVGLAIAAPWGAVLLLRRRPLPQVTVFRAAVVLLAVFAWATWQRCEVWKTEESLWQDVAAKSPHNGRGLMNYGLALMARGDYGGASAYFERAAVLMPNYYTLEINRGVVAGAQKNAALAEQHFLRAIELAPTEASAKYFYARWLHDSGRYPEAATLLQKSIVQNPTYIDSYYLLIQTLADDGNSDGVRAVAHLTLTRFPGDPTAKDWLSKAGTIAPTPELWLNRSLAFYQAGKYPECIAAAKKALDLKPDYSDAWNNIAAAFNSMGKWDEGVAAGEMAVRLNPNSQLAKNNLNWARSQRK